MQVVGWRHQSQGSMDNKPDENESAFQSTCLPRAFSCGCIRTLLRDCYCPITDQRVALMKAGVRNEMAAQRKKAAVTMHRWQ